MDIQCQGGYRGAGHLKPLEKIRGEYLFNINISRTTRERNKKNLIITNGHAMMLILDGSSTRALRIMSYHKKWVP